MCGIAGVLSPDRVELSPLRAMGDAIAHRGPDDHGVWSDQEAGVGLSHRRLSIVDLSPHGHQPMVSADGRLVLCYNGEIYNHAELRRDLDARGHSPEGGWRGHSDTETLVQAIAALGLPAALERCVGMFAFALWDRTERTLSLARDRFGEKPLYFGRAGRDFLFASELKAIRAHPGFAGEIDRGALHAFAARSYIPAPLSIYRGIFKLEPGHILTLTVEAAKTIDRPPALGTHDGVTFSRFWSYREVVRDGLDRPLDDRVEAIAQLEQALAAAIKGQSIADVPVGAFLSGGIDSSAVVALYQKYSNVPVRTYTIGFEQAGFDEAPHARAVANRLGTVHHEHYVSIAEARDVIPLLPAMYDEPFADASQIPTFLVSRFARRDVTVALTGDGGDELFGGYNRHLALPPLWARLGKLPRGLRGPVAAPLGRIPPEYWNRAAGLAGRRHATVGIKVQKALWIAASADGFADAHSAFLDEWHGQASPVQGSGVNAPAFDLDVAPGAPEALRMMYADATSYLPDDVLAKVDRASMAVSLETRVPFLDHRVAAVAARIPLAMKIRGGTGKHILRELLYREAPRELFDRPKAGFAVPVGEWIKGPLRPWAEDLLDPAKMAGEGWLDPVIVQHRWREHVAGRRDSSAALWAILMFQAWLRAQD